MGEAILAGGAASNDGSPKYKYMTFCDIINQNGIYEVPPDVKGQEFEVLVFGGGGGGNTYGGGGGGGNMNSGIFQLGAGSKIQVNIGDGGTNANSGGTTIFGSYLSATGGSSRSYGGSGGSGGGTSYISVRDIATVANNKNIYPDTITGTGVYGGGGGGIMQINGYSSIDTYSEDDNWYLKGEAVRGGNGGIYGGGGAGFFMHINYDGNYVHFRNINVYANGGIGGQYGGNGGIVNKSEPGYNGINTMSYTNIKKDFLSNTILKGNGTGGLQGNSCNINTSRINIYHCSGGAGGGYGGCGGNSMQQNVSNTSYYYILFGGGGGGGYGANGGNGIASVGNIERGGGMNAASGGGGGYGGDGGDGNIVIVNSYRTYAFAGGGGGYGKAGKGGTYGINGGNGGIAAGGCGGRNNGARGGNGIVLIYYQKAVLS